MTKTEYREYIASPHWQQFRKQAIERDSWCVECYLPRWLAQIAYDQDLHVHHLSYARLGHESPADVAVLCRRCHEIETFGRSDLKPIKQRCCSHCGGTFYDMYRQETLCDYCNGVHEGLDVAGALELFVTCDEVAAQ